MKIKFIYLIFYLCLQWALLSSTNFPIRLSKTVKLSNYIRSLYTVCLQCG